jgi:CysZ protein
MILRALSLTISQLGDPRILRVFGLSLLMSLLLCAVLGLGLAEGVRYGLDRFGAGPASEWEHAALVIGGVALAMLAFRAVAVPVMGVFGDSVVAAIEAKHYPQAAGQARAAPLWLSARLGLASLARVVLINLLALPVYIFFIFTAIGPLILFMAVNAILLGRDLAEMVAVRHLPLDEARGWLRANRLQYGLLGLIVTGLFLIPFINLVAPIIGAGAATHLFHRRLGSGRQGSGR